MRIILTQGAYRYRPEGSKTAVVVQLGDPAFDLPEAEAERLIALGVARVADSGLATAPPAQEPAEAGEPLPPDEEAPEDQTELYEDRPEYSVKMTVKQLRSLMDERGIDYDDQMSKAQLVERLDSFYEGEGETAEDSPVLSAQLPAL